LCISTDGNEKVVKKGELVTGYAYDPHTVDAEFLLSKRQYAHITGRDQGNRNALAEKNALDTELDRMGHVLTAICDYNEKSAPDTASLEAAKVALESKVLSCELVDLLIEQILIFTDNRMEIEWKISGFAKHR